MTLAIQSIYLPKLPFQAAACKQTVSNARKWCAGILDKHTDAISSFGYLTLNSCILASKIVDKIPVFLPRLSLVILNGGGIIWLNIQVRDCSKSFRDLQLAVRCKDYQGMLLTACKTAVKAMDTLLICTMLAASVFALAGFPGITLTIYAVVRPIALVSLATGIGLQISDYFKNKALIKKLERISQEENADKRVADIMKYFVMILNKKASKDTIGEERKLAVCLIRQLEYSTVETFQEEIVPKMRDPNYLNSLEGESAQKLFYNIKLSMENKQKMTKASLGLMSLGYVVMGVNRVYPDTLLQSSLTWGISMLYTTKLVIQKYQNYKLHKRIM